MAIPVTQTNQSTGWAGSRLARIVGHAFASLSLLICLIFWVGFFYAGAAETPLLKFTGLQWLEIDGVGVALSAIAALLRSKLWRVALPVSLLMFFFTMYVMGT
ncbi:MAG TPA: hypothetical protein VJO16_19515 [Candidatus Acidoferrum sp.]|nr:hypothetical protein [Candidatus Acidoferrum sp.]